MEKTRVTRCRDTLDTKNGRGRKWSPGGRMVTKLFTDPIGLIANRFLEFQLNLTYFGENRKIETWPCLH